MTLEAIKFHPSTPASLSIIDQLLLPHQTVYIPIPDASTAHAAIKRMSVRGAPAIAIVAVLSVAVEIDNLWHEYSSATKSPANLQNGDTGDKFPSSAQDMQALIQGKLEYLLTSRPTAVNLKDAVGKLNVVVQAEVEREGTGAEGIKVAYVKAAERMLVDDVDTNKAIGEEGARWVEELVKERGVKGEKMKVGVLTHCNTGSLATAGYGTALGVVRSLWEKGMLNRAYYTETRPYNQGSRLTGYELIHDEIPATLITDSMAAALFRLRGSSENIVAVIVGADRVAANGDTANKIGTYGLAILARHHGIKFLVAAPRTTIDLATKSGEDIVIEQRPPEEMLSIKGPRNMGFKDEIQSVDTENVESVSLAALGTQPWNPSFDVTPTELIDGIITEKGVMEKDAAGQFDLQSIFDK